MEILKNWTDSDRKNYGNKVVIAEHRLSETGLFSDERLAHLLDTHPNHLIDVTHLPDNPDYPDQQVTVDFSGFDGKALIEAVKTNSKIWINIREVINRSPEYKKIHDQFHGELQKLSGKNKDRRNCRGGILISSAQAATPYHADPTITHLLHLRGHKQMWVYPVDQKYIPDRAYEAILLGEIDEDMPYDEKFDYGAICSPADLYGGEFVTWPHRAPHRVKNRSFCVSMTIEFTTRQTAFVNAGMFANGVLRRRFGQRPEWNSASKPRKLLTAATGFTMRKIGLSKNYKRTDLVKFKFDPSSDGWVRPVPHPYERVH